MEQEWVGFLFLRVGGGGGKIPMSPSPKLNFTCLIK